MKSLMVIVVCGFCIVSIYSLTYAEQFIDQCCAKECMEQGGTPENCNSVCSLTDNSGKVIKNSECITFCLNTRYLCYLTCGNEGNTQEKLAIVRGLKQTETVVRND